MASTGLFMFFITEDPQTLVDQLRGAGYPVDDPSISVEQLAETTGAESDGILITVFR